MCRWIAYSGAPLRMEELILKPEYSLIEQSYSCREGAEPTNGDGFGMGWYSDLLEPGVFRSTEPAWNDRNLASLARNIRSHLFIAHVRATTGTPIQQTNCHPFCHGNWMFAHNGYIDQYPKLQRELAMAVEPSMYPSIEGNTDSELMFFLALTFGLASEPIPALERMAGFVEKVGRDQGVEFPLQMTLAVSEGQRLFAVRYSSQRQSRSLYHSADIKALQQVNPDPGLFSPGAVAVVSEPLDAMQDHWVQVPESTALLFEGGEVQTTDFVPTINPG
ncbi:MAG: class II glutamine amidotransferase [Mariniblastus sp.]|nr:class II glutamine amidotransferase [Mariniblastus sp.]